MKITITILVDSKRYNTVLETLHSIENLQDIDSSLLQAHGVIIVHLKRKDYSNVKTKLNSIDGIKSVRLGQLVV